MTSKNLIILGIRGIPAAHGGFETFAEQLAPWLRDNGWTITVYCQVTGVGPIYEDEWQGIRRVHIPIERDSALGTILFDIASHRHAMHQAGLILTLGYNTGFLSGWLRLRGRRNVINMDGLEWKRAKYALFPKIYLWINERLAAWSGNCLIADHPAIGDHLASRVPRHKIAMIPYGSNSIGEADPALLAPLGLEPGRFFTLIARPEPENSILEIVQAFSRKRRGAKLVVLGKYDSAHAYQASVIRAAGDEIVLPGAIYDRATVSSLRFHSIAYLHGHKVGGTNPSLVEALGAGNAIIAHDNPFNRWVAGDAGLFFQNADQCEDAIEALLMQDHLRERLREAARARWNAHFTWPQILGQYEALLENQLQTAGKPLVQTSIASPSS